MFSLIVSFLLSQTGVLLLVVAGLVYYYTKNWPEAFRKQGIKYLNPAPLIGNMFEPVMNKIPYSAFYKKMYDKFPDASVIGLFEIFSKSYMIKDPELVKQIEVKEFDSFMNRRSNPEHDEILGKNLLTIRDQKWKDMRSVLSPAFTGSKMRYLFNLVNECAQKRVHRILSSSKAKGGFYNFEAKDLFSRFANDIIATTAFGIEVDSIKDTENEFFKQAQTMLTNTFLVSLKFIISVLAPFILKLFNLQLLDFKSSHYLKDVLNQTIKYRESQKVVRSDMIQLLLQAKTKGRIDDDSTSINEGNISKHGTVKWTDEDLVAQSMIFFIGGYDTVSALFSFMAYELAKNPEIQDRLREEVDSLTQKLAGKDPSYDDINKMTYLEMVMNETLRMWPSVILTDRICSKETILVDSNDKKITIHPGDGIIISIFSMHRDPNHFPEPQKFDPERFSEENKGFIKPYTYQAFGQGPRSCIGNRFAIMECKTVFYHIISKFTIEATKRTEIPLKLKPGLIQNIPANGIWLQFKVRE